MIAPSSPPRPARSPGRGRRGATLVLVLACLAVVALIATTMLQGGMAARRRLRAEHHLRQVECLLDAGLARIETTLGTRPADTAERDLTERLELSAADLGDDPDGADAPAVARLTLTAEPQADGSWLARAVADYPLDGPVPVRRTRVVVLAPSSREATDPSP